jgi:hypothetical protein
MRTFKKLATGLALAAIIALALNASSGAAYAKLKTGGSSTILFGTGGITIDLSTPTDFHVGGVTWE